MIICQNTERGAAAAFVHYPLTLNIFLNDSNGRNKAHHLHIFLWNHWTFGERIDGREYSEILDRIRCYGRGHYTEFTNLLIASYNAIIFLSSDTIDWPWMGRKGVRFGSSNWNCIYIIVIVQDGCRDAARQPGVNKV